MGEFSNLIGRETEIYKLQEDFIEEISERGTRRNCLSYLITGNPTNVKLLWECVEWMHGQMKRTCKYLKILTPRTNFLEQKDKYFSYMRMRKKPWKQTTKRTRSLLYLLNKLIEEQDKSRIRTGSIYSSRRSIIRREG